MAGIKYCVPGIELQLALLAQIGSEGHHFAAISDLQPFEDDAGIEAAGVGEDDFLDVRHGLDFR